jgi:hypothetical protein
MAEGPPPAGAQDGLLPSWELAHHSQRYLASVAIAVAVFVPQLALLALLLTTTTRVGSFDLVLVLLVVSDLLTIWQSAVALKESYLSHATESWLGVHFPGRGLGDVSKDPERPSMVRFIAKVDQGIRPTGSRSLALLLLGLILFVLGVSSYIGWLWYNP